MMHRAACIGLILLVVCLAGCDRAPPDTPSSDGGHWTVAVAWGPNGRRLLHKQLHAIGGWYGSNLRSACMVISLEGERVQACRVPAFDAGGGYYGGHVACAWRRGQVVYRCRRASTVPPVAGTAAG